MASVRIQASRNKSIRTFDINCQRGRGRRVPCGYTRTYQLWWLGIPIIRRDRGKKARREGTDIYMAWKIRENYINRHGTTIMVLCTVSNLKFSVRGKLCDSATLPCWHTRRWCTYSRRVVVYSNWLELKGSEVAEIDFSAEARTELHKN